jgi:hypothetical protein
MRGIKKKNAYLLPALVLLIVACNSKGRSMFRAENNVDFDTVRVSERYHLEGDTSKPFCDIRVEFIYPASSSKINVDTLQRFFVKHMFGTPYDTLTPAQAVDSYVNSFKENYSADAATYRESAKDMMELNELIPGIDLSDSEHAMKDVFYSYYENLSDSVVYNQYGIIAFQVKQSNNKGGATSYNSYRNYVINLNTGNRVTESDLFNAGYDSALQSLIVTSLLDQNNVKTVSELEDLGFFGIQEIVPNKNFLLNEKGIIYTFNKGEYSAYQLDAPQVFIPYGAIRSLLKENTIVHKLAELQ